MSTKDSVYEAKLAKYEALLKKAQKEGKQGMIQFYEEMVQYLSCKMGE